MATTAAKLAAANAAVAAAEVAVAEATAAEAKAVAGVAEAKAKLERLEAEAEAAVARGRVKKSVFVEGTEQKVGIWLALSGFEPGDLRGEKDFADGDGWMLCPLQRACYEGEVNVARWLHGHGAEEDVSKTNGEGETPMALACEEGHLLTCKWLFDEAGAQDDILQVQESGDTCMHAAILYGPVSSES